MKDLTFDIQRFATISNELSNTLVSGTSGDDSITNGSWGNNFNNVTINGGNGDDTIMTYGKYVLVNGGDGDDEIHNWTDPFKSGSYTTLNGGDGNDFIQNGVHPYVLINGGSGVDQIRNYGYQVTINGGADYDMIYLYSESNKTLIQYANGDGNDIISGIKPDDTLKISGASYSTTNSGNNLIVAVGNYSITVNDGLNVAFTIDGTLETGNFSNIEGTEGVDYISNDKDSVTIDALGGNDSIVNTGAYTTIYGGDGDDEIGGTFNYSSVFGGNGNDTINIWMQTPPYENSTNSATADGGAGNDFIFVAGTNVTNSIFLGGYDNDTISNNSPNNSIDGGDGHDEIKNCGDAKNVIIKGGAGNDSIRQEATNATIIGGIGNDTIELADISSNNLIRYANGDGYDIIYDIKTSDTLQISGAKYTTTKNGDDLIIGVGSGKITLVGAANTAVNIEGTLSGGGNDTTPVDENTLPAGWKYANTAKTSITATLTSADILNLIEEYGAGVIKVDGSKTTGGIVIYGNELDNSIKGGKGADTISGGYGDDTISLGGGADLYIYQGGNDLIQDYANADKIQIDTVAVEISGIETVGNNIIYSTSEGDITVKSGKGKQVKLVDADGNDIIFKEDDDLYKEYTAKADNIENGDDNATINALAGHDKIINRGSAVSINAGDGNDVIVGYDENDSLHITSGTYSHSISGSDFIVKVGSNTIKLKDAADKNILIKNASGKIETISPEVIELPDGWKYGTSSKTNSNAEILTATIATAEKEIDLTEEYGNGVLKVDGSKVSDATITGNAENNSIKAGGGDDELDGGEGDDTLTGGKGDDIFIYSGVEIYGNDLDNSIKGGKGNDILDGGSGNDTLTGGAGADTYVYSGGDDVITDYANVDAVQFDTENITDISREISGKNVIYSTNVGTLTLKNASTKNITLIDSNGDDFTLNKNVAENLWFMEDNFDNCDLDSIVEEKYSVTEIQTENYNLGREQNILTYCADKKI